MNRRISLILILVMILTIIPIDISNAVGITDTLTIRTSKETITKDQIGVNYDTTYIDVVYGTNYFKDPLKDIDSIDILVNGNTDKSNYNFSLALDENKIRISLKNSNSTLNPNSLYTIHIPQGFFKDNLNIQSEEIYYNFVTKSNTTSQADIITSTGYSGGTITYNFVDDIELNTDAVANIQNYITLTSSLIDNLKDDTYAVDSILNYDVSAQDNKLVVKRKGDADFETLSKYTVTLKPNCVYLKNAINSTIYNQQNSLSFSTDDIVNSTDPTNGQTSVVQHPIISVNFKYPINSNIDKTKINLISRSGSTYTDVQNYVYATDDFSSLKIDMNNLYTDTGFELSKNEEYTIKLSAGAVSLKDKIDIAGNPYNYNKDITFSFQTIKDRPQIIGTTPSDSLSDRFDENDLLKPGEDTYYLEVVFKDLDDSIKLYNDNATPVGFTLYSDGSSNNLIDDTKTIKLENGNSVNETKIRIPIKEKLESNTKYSAYIPENIVENGALDENGIKLGNESKQISFITTAIPIVSKVVDATVGEDYDEDEPIILESDLFYSSGVVVYFEDEVGNRERAEKVSIDGKIAKVYLPDGSDRLEPGIYKIIIENDDNHITHVEVERLSVIKKGDFIPHEDKRIIREDSKGEVEESIKVSEDTLILSSSYKDKSNFELDLDEMMGEDTLVRKIKYEGSKSGVYSNIYTKSKYANIDIYNLRPVDYDRDKDIVVSLGRVEPIVVDSIKSKLKSAHIVSDFIQVTGDNFAVDSINIRIPYEYAGDNINVLRYDDEMRNWYTVPFSIDRADKNVYIKSSKKGIFVIVD